MTIIEYLTQEIMKKRGFYKERAVLVGILKAYDKNKQILLSLNDCIHQMKLTIMAIEVDKQREVLINRQRKMKMKAKCLIEMYDDCYQNYISQIYQLIEMNPTQFVHYQNLLDDTKKYIMCIQQEINSLSNEMYSNIRLVDNYRRSYKSMRKVFHDFKNLKGKRKRFYELALKKKEHDYLYMGKLRKAMILNNKRLKDVTQRFTSVIMKINHMYDKD